LSASDRISNFTFNTLIHVNLSYPWSIPSEWIPFDFDQLER